MALWMLAAEWTLVAAGLPAVVILLGSSAGCTRRSARSTRYWASTWPCCSAGGRERQPDWLPTVAAAPIGIADGALGLLVILANALLKRSCRHGLRATGTRDGQGIAGSNPHLTRRSLPGPHS